jgi:hypothetical protein
VLVHALSQLITPRSPSARVGAFSDITLIDRVLFLFASTIAIYKFDEMILMTFVERRICSASTMSTNACLPRLWKRHLAACAGLKYLKSGGA